MVAAGDSRLLPESFRGVTATNTSIDGLSIQGGRLHAMSQPVSSDMRENFATFYAGPVNSPWIAYGGGDYVLNKNLSFSLYSSRLKDAWNQYYAGTAWTYPLADDLSLFGGLNYYKAVDEGKQLLGQFDNNIWSGRIGVKLGAHSVALSTSATTATTTSTTCGSPTRSSSTTRSSTATSTRRRNVRGWCATTST